MNFEYAVQARETKLILSVRQLGYERRLERIDLYSLKTRRLRGQLIETFKILKGFNKINYRDLFTLCNNQTRTSKHNNQLRAYSHNNNAKTSRRRVLKPLSTISVL